MADHICYTFSVYCTVPLDPEDGQPEVSAKDIERQLTRKLNDRFVSPIDADIDLELMDTQPVAPRASALADRLFEDLARMNAVRAKGGVL